MLIFFARNNFISFTLSIQHGDQTLWHIIRHEICTARSRWNGQWKKKKGGEERERKDTNLSLSRDLSSSMRLRRSSSRCSRKRCAAMACCLSSSNFRCRSSFCLSRTSFALSTSFALPVDSRPENNHQRSITSSRLVSCELRVLRGRSKYYVSQTVCNSKKKKKTDCSFRTIWFDKFPGIEFPSRYLQSFAFSSWE